MQRTIGGMTPALSVLEKTFGYSTFRGQQRRDHRPGHRRRRRARAHADGRRQVAVLPDSRARARGHRRRHLAAHRPHAGPGRCAGRRRGARGLPQLDPVRRRAPRASSRPTSPASSTSSTSRPSGWARRAPPTCSTAARSRCSRSTRRTACRSGATTSGPTTCGSRCCTSAGRRCRASRSPRPRPRRPGDEIATRLELGERAALRVELRPPEHPVPHRGQGPAAAAAADPASAPSTRATRASSTASLARPSRRPRSSSWSRASPRCRTTRVSTRGTRVAQPVAVPARGRRRHGRDDRVRHGHRQARRALRRPPRPAQERRGLLPGDRARRPRRTARRPRGSPTDCRMSCSSAA